MPTIDMQDTNRRAIVALDAGDIFHAERLFARNYRAYPCLMTMRTFWALPSSVEAGNRRGACGRRRKRCWRGCMPRVSRGKCRFSRMTR